MNAVDPQDRFPADGEGFLCSPQQRHLLRLIRRGGADAYRADCTARISGSLDPDALRLAVQRVVERHELLRTVFRPQSGMGLPVQVVGDRPDFGWTVRDLRAVPAEQRSARVADADHAHRAEPFDLARGPMLRATLVSLADDDHLLLLTLPAVGADAWGLGHLVAEIADAYEEVRGGAQLPQVSIQYPDLATVFDDLSNGEQWGDGRAYWERASAISSFRLPLESPADGAPVPGRVEVSTPAALGAGLRELAMAAGVAPAVVLLAAWQVFTVRLTGRGDLVQGVLLDGRTFAELDGALGLCARRVPLAVQVDLGVSFGQLLRACAAALETAQEWQDYLDPATATRPDGTCGDGGPDGDSAGLVPAVGFASYPQVPARVRGDARFSVEHRLAHLDRCALELVVQQSPDRFRIELHHDPSRLDTATVRRWADGFEALLSQLTHHGDRPVGLLPVVSAAEWARYPGHDTDVRWPDQAPPDELFRRQAATSPGRTAIVAGAVTLTYGDLDAQVGRLADRLVAAGVGPETRVALTAQRSLETVVAILAVGRAGGCVVPIDLDQPAARRDAMLVRAGVEVVVAGGGDASWPTGSVRVVDASADSRSAPAADVPRSATAAGDRRSAADPLDQLFAVLHTSGSGGAPKAVMLTRRGILNRLHWGQQCYPLDADDRVLHSASFAFDFSMWELFAPLAVGATVVLADTDTRMSSEALVSLMAREAVTIAHFIPSMLRLVVEEPGLRECRALRLVFAGGEVLRREWADRLLDAVPVTLFNQYGPTETSIDVTAERVVRGGPGDLVPIGRPIANTRAYVLDAAVQPVPVGAVGELYIAGDGLARGYANDPAATAQRFVADPFGGRAGARMYRTGDLVRRDPDGVLEFVGRTDDQVKIRGFRVELGEAEAVLQRHPAVRAAAVAAWPDPRGDLRLVAYLERASGPIEVGELRELLTRELPAYLTPTVFLEVNPLPRTASGKVDRRRLPEPGSGLRELGREYVPPRSATEEKVAAIWADLLQVERVGALDGFLELGGHSLLATRLVSRVQAEFGVKISLVDFFDEPTVAAVAAAMDRAKAASDGAGSSIRGIRRRARSVHLVALQPGRGGRPLFLVHPISGGVGCYAHLVAALGEDQPVYGLAAAGLEEGGLPEDDLPRMAQRYLASIRAVQPSGPYLLGGWSFGGLVALEMARLLEASGQQGTNLTLIDTRAPIGPTQLPDVDDVDMLIAIIGDVARMMRRPTSLTAADLTPLNPDQRIRRVLEQASDDGMLVSANQRDQLERQLRVYRAHTVAWCRYPALPYQGQINLFRADESRDAVLDPAGDGWLPVLGERPTLRKVPGDHYTLLGPPHVEHLARELRSLITGTRGSVR